MMFYFLVKQELRFLYETLHYKQKPCQGLILASFFFHNFVKKEN